MKNKKFSKQMIFLLGFLAGFIICGAIFLVTSDDAIEDGVIRVRGTGTPEEKLIHFKEGELTKHLHRFNKVEYVMVSITASDGEISFVTVYLETSEVISESEIDDMTRFISEYLDNLDKEYIGLMYSVS
ncbi:MAG: hypothetical protein FWE14_04405 [Lachnospiraceae bacterium]|nr:hypothetical protein [Lachnospiraceae bacterium]